MSQFTLWLGLQARFATESTNRGYSTDMLYSQHHIAIGLILIEAGIFAYLSESWTVAIMAAVAAVLNWVTDRRVPLKPSQRFVAALGLAVPFTFQWAFAPYEPEHLRLFILYPLAHAGGQYGLALQASYLWVKQPHETWSAAFPLCGVCVLMAAADIQTTAWQSHVFQVAVLAFVLLTAAYFSCARIRLETASPNRSNGRLILLVATMGATFVIAVGSSLWLERSWATIERLYTEWMLRDSSDGGAGFSRQARLGNISNQPSPQDQLTALRVYSIEEPGYLRGAAYDRYDNGNWTGETSRTVTLRELEFPPDLPVAPDQPVYRLPATGIPQVAGVAGSPWHSIEVWPVAALGGDAIFTTLESEWLSVSQSELIIDANGIAYPDGVTPDSSSRCFTRQQSTDVSAFGTSAVVHNPFSAESPPGLDPAALTSLPGNLDPRIRDLARTIFAECPTPELKVYEASRWFKKNYHYEIGMKVPSGQDPLTYFLLRRPAAHCEYFATGTVILLRLAGVPCRYVTGFVATEYNYFGGYWLARNKDAHAWVEAWLPGRGWVTVESTPSAGVPHSPGTMLPSHLWDDLLLRVQMLRTQLAAGTWRGIVRAVRTILAMLLTTPHGWLMLAGLLVWAVVLWRRHVHFVFRRKYDPISAEFHQLLGELDRRLERLDLSRPAWETLTQFAERLKQHPSPVVQAAAEWYEDYCAVRYRSDTIPVEIRRLRATLPDLVRQLKELKDHSGTHSGQKSRQSHA